MSLQCPLKNSYVLRLSDVERQRVPCVRCSIFKCSLEEEGYLGEL